MKREYANDEIFNPRCSQSHFYVNIFLSFCGLSINIFGEFFVVTVEMLTVLSHQQVERARKFSVFSLW